MKYTEWLGRVRGRTGKERMALRETVYVLGWLGINFCGFLGGIGTEGRGGVSSAGRRAGGEIINSLKLG